MKSREQLINNLNNKNVRKRLKNLKKIKKLEKKDASLIPKPREFDANNHIHTFYSFSPYSPTQAVFKAYNCGLITMGIIDHDSVGGVREFIKAAEIAGCKCTVGFEVRVKLKVKGFEGRTINNPDQADCAYFTVHGIPHQNIDKAKEFLAAITAERNIRNRLMVDKINKSFGAYGIAVSYDEVVNLSMLKEGGSVTERHILFALSKKIANVKGRGEKVLEFIKELNIRVSETVAARLKDVNNIFYEYDLLGVLKSDARFFYIDADKELVTLERLVEFCKEIGAITAYAYLGDIETSVTGDKRSQKFEDGFLEPLLIQLKESGVNAVAYMPTRNTEAQLKRLQALCAKYGFFEISGEDINSPRQRFECDKLKEEMFLKLTDSTYALIGHEKTATENIEEGMFSESIINKFPDINERVKLFAEIGKSK